MTNAAMLAPVLVDFGRALRVRGLTIGPDQLVRYQAALDMLDPTRLDDLYWAGLTCLTTHHRHHAIYDEVFALYFLAPQAQPEAPDTEPTTGEDGQGEADDAEGTRHTRQVEQPAEATDDEDSDEMSEGHIGAVASPIEVLRSKTFADCNPDELALLHTLLRNLRLSLPTRVTRRLQPGRPYRRLDLRRTMRASLRTQGEMIHRSWRRRRIRPRPTVVLLDVSGSMTGYSRALLQFAYALSRAGSRVEVFCFGTRLTRITGVLGNPDADTALEHAAATVNDWDGGTRIGASIRAFLQGWGTQGFVRHAVIVICSDGLERGDPDLLRIQMQRLARTSHRIIWVNPLKGDPDYVPLARGMQAALPTIDHLVAGDTLDSLERLADLLRSVR